MGDDITNIIIPEPTTKEETVEEIGEELLARLDELDTKIGEFHVRIAELEGKLVELDRICQQFAVTQYALFDHIHEGFALTEHVHEHEHEGYAPADHEHQGTQAPREPDNPPRKQHPYFRKLNEF